MIRIFLSHAKEDEQTVLDLYEKLQQKGYKPWIDRKELLPGDSWRAVVPAVIEESDIFIACFSCVSVAKHSYVQKEIRIALNTQVAKPPETTYLIPIRLDDCTIPNFRQEECGMSLHDIQSVDVFEYDGLNRLFEALKRAFPDAYQDHYEEESEYYDSTGAEYDGFDFFDIFGLLKWGTGGLLALAAFGAIASGGGGSNYGPSEPGGIIRSQRVIVTPQGGNCQPLRKEPDDSSENLGCIWEGTELVAISDELQSGWIRVRGSANGIGWVFHHGVSPIEPNQ